MATLILALAFQGCSFLIGDPYGNYFQKADRWINLRSELKNLTGLNLNDMNGLAVVKAMSGGTPCDYVFFMADYSNKTSRIRALGYDGLNLLSFDAPSTIGVLSAAVDANTDIKVGDTSYFASSLMSTLHTGIPTGKWLITDNAPAMNYLLYSNGTILNKDSYDSATWSFGVNTTLQISSGVGQWNLARVAVLGDGRVCLLFSLGMGNQGKIQAVTFADYSTLANAFIAGTPIMSMVSGVEIGSQVDVNTTGGSIDGPSGIDAWITENGVVAMTTNNNNQATFSRFPLSSGSSVDSYSMTYNSGNLCFFESAGTYWYVFDAGSGRLVRLRTWWK